jgi:hypothetical protein
MHEGEPTGARLFRLCMARAGIDLTDPSAPLGTKERCRAHLESAGLEPIDIVAEPVTFTHRDVAAAWDSNVRSPAHAAIHRLGPEALDAVRRDFERELARIGRTNSQALSSARVLFALARKA